MIQLNEMFTESTHTEWLFGRLFRFKRFDHEHPSQISILIQTANFEHFDLIAMSMKSTSERDGHALLIS